MGHYDEEWHTVRHGRRRGRSREQRHYTNDTAYTGKRAYWVKDRASPNPPYRRGRTQSQYPNRPVPPQGRSYPARSSRDTRVRSYADVVKHGHQKTQSGNTNTVFHRRNVTKHQRGVAVTSRDQNTAPTDPKFGRLVRQLHKVIKTVHHYQNVAVEQEKPAPKMITRMVYNLANMIKPACPNPDTADLIVGNAQNWGYTTMQILQEHYKAVLDQLLTDLKNDHVTEWTEAFNVATKWARKNLPHLSQEVIDHAKALISSLGDVGQGTGRKERPRQNPDKEQDRDRGTDQTERQTQTQTQQQTPLPPPPPQRTQPQTGATEKQKTPENTQTNETGGGSVPRAQAEEIERVRQSQDGSQFAALQTPQREEPRPQRARRTFESQNPCVVTENNAACAIEVIAQVLPVRTPKVPPRATRAVDSLLMEDSNEVADETPSLTPIRRPTEPDIGSPGELDTTDQPNTSEQQEEQPSSGQANTSTPKQRLHRVKRHINTDRKMVDWNLTVWKKWLVMGDSNLSRIPGHTLSDLQVESYPGANFRHAESILSKVSTLVCVEKVVLSFGLNSRGQKAKETAVKQMQAAVRMAKKKFPYAELWIPLINFSSALAAPEKLCLQKINAHIQKNMPYIPLLPDSLFETESDLIHWSRATANSMLQHWCSYLNWGTP